MSQPVPICLAALEEAARAVAGVQHERAVRPPGHQVRETIAAEVAHREDQVVDIPAGPGTMRPGPTGPAAVPGYSHRVPSDFCAMTSESASAFQVPAVKTFEKPPKPVPITLIDFQPEAPFPAYIRRAPVPATTARTSAFRSPLKSRG